MQLADIKEIKGKIILKSGLHIGAGDTEMRIGGTDNQVIRNPLTQEPYIPGSSLKGKVRSLLEMKSGLMTKTNGKPLSASLLKNLQGNDAEECKKILKIFGAGGSESEAIADYDIGPTRVSFADCALNNNWKMMAIEKRWGFFEVKSENAIDRIRGVARDPRFIERVVAGAEFDFSVSLKLLAPQEEELFDYLLLGLKLLEMDALGGSGSRGYGRIEFQLEDRNIENKFKNIMPFNTGG